MEGRHPGRHERRRRKSMEKIKGTDIMGIMAFLKDIADLMLLGGEQDGGWQTDAENGTNFANSVTKNSENEGKPACELQTARRYASLTVFVDPGHGSATSSPSLARISRLRVSPWLRFLLASRACFSLSAASCSSAAKAALLVTPDLIRVIAKTA